jgi:phage anti-repressor protein
LEGAGKRIRIQGRSVSGRRKQRMRSTAKIEGEAKEMDGLKVVESGIISVYEDEEARTLVNAREMHEFLESGQDFSDWIKSRVEKYKFLEGEDFSIILWKSTGGRPAREYLLSIDMAKEIAMVENNDKGRQVRRYFIECERRLKAGSGTISAKDAERLRQRAKYLEILERNARTRQAQILKFVVEFFRDILSDASMQVIANEMTVLVTGFRLVDFPEVEKPCSAGETGEICGIIADMVARIASEFGLKTEECRKFVLSKSPSA